MSLLPRQVPRVGGMLKLCDIRKLLTPSPGTDVKHVMQNLRQAKAERLSCKTHKLSAIRT